MSEDKLIKLAHDMCNENSPIITPHTYNFLETIEQEIMGLSSSQLNLIREIKDLKMRIECMEDYIALANQ